VAASKQPVSGALVAVIVGAVIVVTGAVWFFTADRGRRDAVQSREGFTLKGVKHIPPPPTQ